MVNEDKLKEFQKDMEEIVSDPLDSKLIQDNKSPFFHNDILYRVRMPNQKELFIAEQHREQYKVDLISQGVKNKKKLTKLLKDADEVDIEVLEKEKSELEEELIHKFVDLGCRYSEEKNIIDKLKNEIKELDIKHQKICYTLSEHLKPCLESRIDDLYYNILTTFCTERNENEDNWVRVWSSDLEFDQADPALTKKAIKYFAHLFSRTRSY